MPEWLGQECPPQEQLPEVGKRVLQAEQLEQQAERPGQQAEEQESQAQGQLPVLQE